MVELIDDPQQLHVLVIDEMNRANLPRVFGELMYLFEYRDDPINLQYTNDFELPSNLLFMDDEHSRSKHPQHRHRAAAPF